MERKSFKMKNQLKKYTYVYIVLILFVLLGVFVVFGNLNQILVWIDGGHQNQSGSRVNAVLTSGIGQEQAKSLSYEDPDHAAVGVLGDGELGSLAVSQLQNLKQAWTYLQADSSGAPQAPDSLEIIIVAKESLSGEELSWLQEQAGLGRHLIFARMPSAQNLQNRGLLDLMGIQTLGSVARFPGMRTAKEVMLGTVLEGEKAQVSAYQVTLMQQTKLLGVALPEGSEDLEDTELPPILWRYVREKDAGYVYVCNGDFMDGEMGYAVITAALSDIYGTYLYPVVNAYCVMVDGFPYLQNSQSEVWERLYSRDALGIARDLFFPELKRCEDLYDLKLTYFTPDYWQVANADSGEAAYYRSEIQSKEGQLAGKNGQRLYLRSEKDKVSVTSWKPGFEFYNRQAGSIQIPVNLTEMEDYQEQLLNMSGIIRGTGFFSLKIDIQQLLSYDGENENWVDYCKALETVLGTQKQDYPWLERVTADQALERIDNYLMIRPQCQYREDGIQVSIENFQDKAWFMLKTSQEDVCIDHGTVEEIEDGLYLVEVTEASAQITWRM